MALLEFTDKGLYCPPGDFYIDPWKPVRQAVITHGHSDHARGGHRHYLCHVLTQPVLRVRLGKVSVSTLEWGQKLRIGDTQVSLHPAGHVIGSSQVRVEHRGEVWVCSGDYKTEDDGLSGAFEPVRCHTFITESTFGLPVFHWKPQQEVFRDMADWVRRNHAEGFHSRFEAYSLGKSQRILQAFEGLTDQIYVHASVWQTHEAFREAGVRLPRVLPLEDRLRPDPSKPVILLGPSSGLQSVPDKDSAPIRQARCSGWMALRNFALSPDMDACFCLSDHADWPSLLEAIRSCGAENIFVTHGYQKTFSRYLKENGWNASEVVTPYEGEALSGEPD